MISAVTQSRACWHPPPGSPPGLNQKWEDPRSTSLLPHQAPGPGLVLIMFVRLDIAATGLGPLLWEDLSSHLPFLGLKTGLVTESQGCIGDALT